MGRVARGAQSGRSLALFEPRPTDRLCSAHFEDSMFERNFAAEFISAGMMTTKKRCDKKLVAGAVPTLFSHRKAVADGASERRESLYLKRKYSDISEETVSKCS